MNLHYGLPMKQVIIVIVNMPVCYCLMFFATLLFLPVFLFRALSIVNFNCNIISRDRDRKGGGGAYIDLTLPVSITIISVNGTGTCLSGGLIG